MTKAKNLKPAKSRSTVWQVGQPLVFPPRRTPNSTDPLARQDMEAGLRAPFKSERSKRKKK